MDKLNPHFVYLSPTKLAPRKFSVAALALSVMIGTVGRSRSISMLVL
jgi:hypothetical protein